MSLTKFERDVLDLWDRGFHKGQIAAQLDIKPLRVSVVLATFASTDEARADRKMIAQGSALLANAILEMRAG